MHTKRITLPLLAAILGGLLPVCSLRAANAGDVDTSFTASVVGGVAGVVVQADGKVVIAGPFTSVNGTAQAYLARLNVDGSLDATFTATANAQIASLVAQPDGKLLIAGNFTSVNGTPTGTIARLNADGSLDAPFSAGAQAHNPDPNVGVSTLVLESNGQILYEAYYAEYYGHGGDYSLFFYPGRINTDGSSSFTDGTGASPVGPFVRAAQSNGKILLTAGQPNSPLPIVRWNADASFDNSFLYQDWTSYNAFTDIVVQPDDRILASTNTLVRMNAADGSPDATFQVPTVTGVFYKILCQPDSRLLVGGSFTQVNGSNQVNLVRLNTDGTLDTGFAALAAMDGPIQSMALQPDGNVVVAGGFTSIGGATHQGIARFIGTNVAAPQLTSPAAAVGTVGVPFSYQITAANNPTTFAAGSVYNVNDGLTKPLPAGLTLDPATGIISGTPTREGNFVIAIQAANAAGADLQEIPLTIATAGKLFHPAFFTGEEPLADGVYYLKFFYDGSVPTNFFSYYAYLADPHYIYHFDLGYEYLLDAADGYDGLYLYDFASNGFFYTSPVFPFPYLYDFNLNAFLYYYPDPNDPERYNTGGVRYFYNFATGQTITK